MGKRKKQADAHVRLYWYELESPAYRTLSADARALLVECRALFNAKETMPARIFLSVREMRKRLGNVGARRAQRARDELLDRGWLRQHEAGSFHRKNRHATVYLLTNEPTSTSDGAVPSRDFMRWAPKNTVLKMNTHSAQNAHRGAPRELNTWARTVEKARIRQPKPKRRRKPDWSWRPEGMS